MTVQKTTLRICSKGHQYYKSIECPTCPVCEAAKKPVALFMTNISNPARRALENAGIKTLKKLSGFSESELLKLHGLGASSIPKLRKALKEKKMDFEK